MENNGNGMFPLRQFCGEISNNGMHTHIFYSEESHIVTA